MLDFHLFISLSNTSGNLNFVFVGIDALHESKISKQCLVDS